MMSIIKNRSAIKTICSLAVSGLLLSACSSSEEPKSVSAKDFFKDKKLTYVVATKAGGGYDAYGRLISQYMAKELGATIIVKNLPGAGHIIGANFIYTAKPDGTVFGTFNTGLIHSQLLEREGVQFDLRKMSWIGKASGDTRVMVTSAKSQFKTFDDILAAKEPVKFATAGLGSASTADLQLLIEALDINGKILPGFNGNEGEMSMMRGETDGTFGSKSSLQPFVDFGNGQFALRVGGDDDKSDKTPSAMAYAKDDNARSLIGLIDSQAQLARLTAGPPGMPADRLQVLRDAYRNTMKNPDFLADAKKQGLPIEPLIGDPVGEMINLALIQSPEMMTKIKSILGQKGENVSGKIVLVAIEDGGRFIVFDINGKSIKSKISGSRTKLTIAAAEADRGDLTVGMKCDIEYIPGDKNEPKVLSCN